MPQPSMMLQSLTLILFVFELPSIFNNILSCRGGIPSITSFSFSAGISSIFNNILSCRGILSITSFSFSALLPYYNSCCNFLNSFSLFKRTKFTFTDRYRPSLLFSAPVRKLRRRKPRRRKSRRRKYRNFFRIRRIRRTLPSKSNTLSKSNTPSKSNMHLLDSLGPKGKLTSQELLIKDILSSPEPLFVKQKKLLSLKKEFSLSAEYLMKQLEESPERKQQLRRVINALRYRFLRVYRKARRKRYGQQNRAYYPLVMKFLSCEIKSFLLAQIVLDTFSDCFFSSSRGGLSDIAVRYTIDEIGSFALDLIIKAELNDLKNHSSKHSDDNPYITKEYLMTLTRCLKNMERAEKRAKIGTNPEDIRNQIEYVSSWVSSMNMNSKVKNKRKYVYSDPIKQAIKEAREAREKDVLKHDFNLVSDQISLEKKYSLIPCVKAREVESLGLALVNVWEKLGLIEVSGGEWVAALRRRNIILMNISKGDAFLSLFKNIDLNVIKNEYGLPFICVDSLTLNEKRFWQFDGSSTKLPLISNLSSERIVNISEDRMSTMETQVKQPFEICEESLTNFVNKHKDAFIDYIRSLKSTLCSKFYWSDEASFTFGDFCNLNKDISTDLELLRSAYTEYVLHEKKFYFSLRISILFLDYRLYFLIFLDFRGRLYLRGWPLNPQGNKNSIRSLFAFPGQVAMTEVDIHAQGIQILSMLSWENLGLTYTGLIPFIKKPIFFKGKVQTKADAKPTLFENKPDLYQFFAKKLSIALNKFISSELSINKELANTDIILWSFEKFVKDVATRKIVKTLVMFGSYGEGARSQVIRILQSCQPHSILSNAISQKWISIQTKEGLQTIEKIDSLLYNFIRLFKTVKEEHLPNVASLITNLKSLIFNITVINERRNFLKLSLDKSLTAALTYSDEDGTKFKRSFVVNIVHYIDGLIVYKMLKKIHLIQLLHPEKGIHFFTLHDAFFINFVESDENIDLVNNLYKEVMREVFVDDLVKTLLAANGITYFDLAKKSKNLTKFFEEAYNKREYRLFLLQKKK